MARYRLDEDGVKRIHLHFFMDQLSVLYREHMV